ncbi:hypothetical protein ACLB2K_072742 [Fragaria x ananassa]
MRATWRCPVRVGFRQFYKLQIGKRPISSSIERVRALGCLQPASLPLRKSAVSRYELVAFFVFGFLYVVVLLFWVIWDPVWVSSEEIVVVSSSPSSDSDTLHRMEEGLDNLMAEIALDLRESTF